MKTVEIRFWDKRANGMIYGAGISPNQRPIIKYTNGEIEELEGNYVVMLKTHIRAKNDILWEDDIVECDVPVWGGQFLQKMYGVVKFIPEKGLFTIHIEVDPLRHGEVYQVLNPLKVGDIYTNSELLAKLKRNDKT